ncbi:proline-rich transmembrane protein 1-like [Patiria miniata]|uniref:Uncharacterized protein n=1 Tax=Patiria miniata TaxID=46514 RepID=A0A913ZM73_PATMI|nr:proline-rich transmembrane protein 1-like [Patiria miniata]
MSSGYTQFQNEAEAPGPTYPPSQPQPEQGYGPPPQYNYPTYPAGNAVPMVQVVAPEPQTIVSTTTTCQPQDYFGLALFVTICCCLPLGIVGLIKANDVRNRFLVGDIAGAEEASRQAKTYSFVGLGIGIGSIVVSIITVIIIVVVYASEASYVTSEYYG